MKLEARLGEQSFQLELVPRSDGRPGTHFQVCLRDPKGEEVWIPVEVLARHGDRWTLRMNGRVEDLLLWGPPQEPLVYWKDRPYRVQLRPRRTPSAPGAPPPPQEGVSTLRAQMPGKVIQILRQVGEPVQAGDGLVIIEAMKMQNEIRSPRSGTVRACHVQPEHTVNAGDPLFEIG